MVWLLKLARANDNNFCAVFGNYEDSAAARGPYDVASFTILGADVNAECDWVFADL